VPEPSLPLTGGCGCGAVRFEISAPLGVALYCHCTRCQRRTGAAAGASARLAPGSFTITAGADQLRAWAPPEALEKVFCGACGSAIYVRDPETGDGAVVRLGAIDGDPGVRPSAHQFAAYAAPWEPIPDDGLPRYDERLPANPPARP
jgi:hypothetical protein